MKHSRSGKNIRSLATLVTVLSAAVIIANMVTVRTLANRSEQLQQTIRNEARDITGSATIPRGQESYLMERYLEQSADVDALFSRQVKPDAAFMLSAILRKADTLNLELDFLAVRADGILLHGMASEQNAADQLAAEITTLGMKVSVVHPRGPAKGPRRFSITSEP